MALSLWFLTLPAATWFAEIIGHPESLQANYKDLTATSLESWLIRGIIPTWPYLWSCVYIYIYIFGYGSIPINTIFMGDEHP